MFLSCTYNLHSCDNIYYHQSSKKKKIKEFFDFFFFFEFSQVFLAFGLLFFFSTFNFMGRDEVSTIMQ